MADRKTDKRRNFMIFFIVCALILGCGIWLGIKLIRHEQRQAQQMAEYLDWQAQQISELTDRVQEVERYAENLDWQAQQISELTGKTEYLEEKLSQTTDYYNYDTAYSEDAFNYFAIGNSLTLITSWGRGICSTRPDNDYFHLVSSELENRHGTVVSYAYNFSPWERAADRASTLDLIDGYLSEMLDLVTIQLGENVSYTTTYETDLVNLIEYVRQKCPNAQIIVVGDWWDIEKNEMRRIAASKTNSDFADLAEIIWDKSYQSETGQVCYLQDGSAIEVPEGASTHPGDLGMRYIADRVIEKLK